MSMRVNFSKQLLDYRTTNHLTQSQMAEMCGISVAGIRNWNRDILCHCSLRPCAWPQLSI